MMKRKGEEETGIVITHTAIRSGTETLTPLDSDLQSSSCDASTLLDEAKILTGFLYNVVSVVARGCLCPPSVYCAACLCHSLSLSKPSFSGLDSLRESPS